MTLSPALPAVADSPFPAFCTSHDATTRRTGAAALAAALAAASSSWLHLVRYEAPTRWTHLLPADDAAAVLDPSLHGELGGAQVWLLSWLPDQGTPLHDHGSSAGGLPVGGGRPTETGGGAGGGGGPPPPAAGAPGRG